MGNQAVKQANQELCQAVQRGDVQGLQTLLRKLSEGGNQQKVLNELSLDGISPLQIAAKHARLDLLRMLLEANADIDVRDSTQRHNTGPSLFARGDFHNLMKKAQHLVREHLATPSISHRCPNCGKSNPVPDFVQEFRCNHCSAPLLVPTSMQLALYDVANGDTAATPAFVLQIPTEGVHVMDTPDAGGWFRKENGRETNLVLRFSTVDEREEFFRLISKLHRMMVFVWFAWSTPLTRLWFPVDIYVRAIAVWDKSWQQSDFAQCVALKHLPLCEFIALETPIQWPLAAALMSISNPEAFAIIAKLDLSRLGQIEGELNGKAVWMALHAVA
eukprot:g20312.t1